MVPFPPQDKPDFFEKGQVFYVLLFGRIPDDENSVISWCPDNSFRRLNILTWPPECSGYGNNAETKVRSY
jgi:hypothetical protein